MIGEIDNLDTLLVIVSSLLTVTVPTEVSVMNAFLYGEMNARASFLTFATAINYLQVPVHFFFIFADPIMKEIYFIIFSIFK